MTLMLIAVFGVFQILLWLMHVTIYQALSAAFGWHELWLAWLFTGLSVTFVSSSVLAHLFANPFVKWYYRISAYWFGLTQFLFGGTVVFFFLTYGIYATGHYISPAKLGIFSIGIFFLIHCYATWQTNRIKVTRVGVTLSHTGGQWHEFWHGKKIVFVSDVHLGLVRSEGFAKRVVAAIAAEAPEMVLIGGDIFDGVKCHPLSLIRPFGDLHPPQGMYFATGNHEYIEDTDILLKEIKEVGIRILDNQAVDVKGISVAGVDWKNSYKKEEFEKVMADMRIDRTKPSILMRHEPSHLDVAERAGVSLTLCGHTHAGQIFPLGFITRRIYQGFDYGLKPFRDMMVYTSSGVGTWGPPLRLGTKSEIVVITIE
jgi:predicted MPP superfamily phosphohydrolase